jgi:hypothetical protein
LDTDDIGLGTIKLGNIDIASASSNIKSGTIASLLYPHQVPSNLVPLLLHRHQVPSNLVPSHRYGIGIGCHQIWYHGIIIVSASGVVKNVWLPDIPGLIKSEKKGRQRRTPSNSCSSLLKFYLLFYSICCHLHIIVLLQFSKIFW